MRREVARVALVATSLALVVLAIPLAVALHLLLLADERGELERTALRAVVQVNAGYTAGDPAELPVAEPGFELGLYDPVGVRRAGSGPDRADPVTLRSLAGSVAQGRSGSLLVVAVPSSAGERVTGSVRAASPVSGVWRRTALAWSVLAALMAAALAFSVAASRRGARRLAAPLEGLAAASRAIGEGDFSAEVAPCGIPEIDRVSATQNAAARQLGQVLAREREFTANASHQLRTPLAGLQLTLETARSQPSPDVAAVLDEALATTRRLQATIEDVLLLHRRAAADPGARVDGPSGGRRSLGEVLETAEQRWRGRFAAAGRRIGHDAPDDLTGRLLPGLRTAQVLDVLLDNALRHGRGQVMIRARSLSTAIALDVSDEGAGIAADVPDIFRRGAGTDNGIGLSLARELASAMGGRLVLSARTPPVFTLVLPASDTDGPVQPHLGAAPGWQ